ncbi:hypothetical protein MAUB1S_11891 [Mycolicibacterium aubagnense]
MPSPWDTISGMSWIGDDTKMTRNQRSSIAAHGTAVDYELKAAYAQVAELSRACMRVYDCALLRVGSYAKLSVAVGPNGAPKSAHDMTPRSRTNSVLQRAPKTARSCARHSLETARVCSPQRGEMTGVAACAGISANTRAVLSPRQRVLQRGSMRPYRCCGARVSQGGAARGARGGRQGAVRRVLTRGNTGVAQGGVERGVQRAADSVVRRGVARAGGGGYERPVIREQSRGPLRVATRPTSATSRADISAGCARMFGR